MEEQNFSNHVKWVPTFHFFVMPVLLLNFGWSIYRMIHLGFTWDGLVAVLTAAALVTLMFNARLFALKVQDRVIRLEERIRMDTLIYQELCRGKVLPRSKAEAKRMMQDLKNAGAEAILLACTELGMLVQEEDAVIPIYDTALLHAQEAVRISLLD